MRRASKSVGVFAEHGNIVLSFGFDFCAEHEWGVAGINRRFGISNDAADVTAQRYAVTAIPDGALHLIEAEATTPGWLIGQKKDAKHRRLYLLGGDEGPHRQGLEEFVSGYRESYPKPDEPEAHWDEGAFLFSVPAEHKRAEVVRKIYEAIVARDALMFTGRMGGPFGGAGLVIVRRSTIPHALVAQMEDGLAEAKRLRRAAEATSIRERVEAWGRVRHSLGAFFALSPRWISDDRKADSAHPVMFWLNPTDQQNNNFGYYTVEELEQWMEGAGPIPKRSAA